MDDDKNLLQLLDRLLTRVDLACGEDTRRAEIENVVRELEAMLRQQPSVDIEYALAYAWYFHPDRQKDQQIYDRVSILLRSVTDKEPKYFLAWLYLGHNAYDLKQYDQALGYFRHACSVAPPNNLGLKAH